MGNLNAENITNEIKSLIKALKDCGGWVKRENGEGWFNHEILADALSIITSQEQTIKELTEENERLSTRIVANIIIDDEKLEEIKNECLERVEIDIKAIQAAALDMFAEKLKRYYNALNGRTPAVLVAYHIDQIKKEMLRSDSDANT